MVDEARTLGFFARIRGMAVAVELPMTFRFFLPFTIVGFFFTHTTPAHACGGCINASVTGGAQSPSVVTDHRIVVSLSATSTTLWDQLEYEGDPDGFAWVLPYRGNVRIAVGSDRFVDALAQLTAPRIQGPTVICRQGRGSSGTATDADYGGVPASSGGSGGCGGGSLSSSPSGSGGSWNQEPVASERPIAQSENEVVVSGRDTVGPYDVVHIRPAMGAKIVDWLRRNGYDVPFAIEPILNTYTAEGFDFVAVRLRPGFGVRAMRPIRVTWEGSVVTFPLRLVAAGVAESVGIQLFVIGDGRWRTKSYPSYLIPRDSLVWNFATMRSNYTKLRADLASDEGAFALESSIRVAPWAIPEPEPTPQEPPPPAVDSGDASETASDVDVDSETTEVFDAIADVDGEVAIDAALPEPKDVDVAFPAGARIVTRLRADLRTSALSKDLIVEADEDQSVLSPEIAVTHYERFAVVCPQAAEPAPKPSPPPATPTSSATPYEERDGCECSLAERAAKSPSVTVLASAAVLGVIRRIRRRRRS
jgi:MYXO-CTERM domain-containing protein